MYSVSLVFKKVSAKDLKVDEQAVKKRAPKEGTQRAVDSERLSECAPDSTACLVRGKFFYLKFCNSSCTNFMYVAFVILLSIRDSCVDWW